MTGRLRGHGKPARRLGQSGMPSGFRKSGCDRLLCASCEKNSASHRAACPKLVRAKVDLIVTQTTPATLAAKRMTATIPIVIATDGDAGRFRSGYEHGGNVTGMTFSRHRNRSEEFATRRSS